MGKRFDEEAFFQICKEGEKYAAKQQDMVINPKETQEEFLKKLLDDNKDTEIGKKYRFKDITNYEEFSKNVPISEYPDYHAYISRMVEMRETDLISAYPIIYYAASSGSTGIPKRIPVSVQNLESLSGFSGELVYYRLYEEIKKQGKKPGPVCFLIDFYTDKMYDITSFGSISAQIGYSFKEQLLATNTSPEALQYLHEHTPGISYLKALFALNNRDLSCIFATFSSIVFESLKLIETQWKTLVDDIRFGKIDTSVTISEKMRNELQKFLKPDPARADELEEAFKTGFGGAYIPKIWPNLSMFCCIGGSFFEEYTRKIRKRAGDIPMYMLSYTASESQFAIPLQCDDTSYAPLASEVFFEFRSQAEEDEGKIYLIDELEEDKEYELIITNMSGFYRYRMFDIFHIDRFEGKMPLGHISYRLNQMTNMVGEHVSTEDIEYVIREMAKHENMNCTEYALYTDYSTSPGRYIILVEPDEDKGKGVQAQLGSLADELLRKANRSYNKYREQNTIGAPVINYMEPGSFALYRDLQLTGGIFGNQLKPVRLIDNIQKEKFFFGLAEGPFKAISRVLFDMQRQVEEMNSLKVEISKLKKENADLQMRIKKYEQ